MYYENSRKRFTVLKKINEVLDDNHNCIDAGF